MKLIGENIKKMRESRKMTQTVLGAKFKPPINMTNISAWERNAQSPSLHNLDQLLKILECTYDELVYGTL